MKSIVILAGLLCFADAMIDMKGMFDEWKLENGKEYDTMLEHRYRFSVFSENYANIQLRNSFNRTVTLGLNKFADLTMMNLWLII